MELKRYYIETDKVDVSMNGEFFDVDGSNIKIGTLTIIKDGEVFDTVSAPSDSEFIRSFEILPKKKACVVVEEDAQGNKFPKLVLIRFVDYHRHTGYSLLDGGVKIEDVVKATELFGAITDHGVMFGTLEYYKDMKKHFKKPIIGFEAYCETIDGKKDGNHLILLIKNQQGYENACKLVSLAEENYYYKPHVNYEMLEKYGEGLVCTSACIGGEISQLLLTGKYDKAVEVVETFQGIFGDDFYLEIQRHKMPEEAIVNPLLIDLSKETGVKLVGATDSHFLEKEDSFAHEVLLAIGTKAKLSDPKRMRFSGEGYHIHTATEFEELFSDIPEVIYNLYEIAEKCEFKFKMGKVYMPEFDVPAPFINSTSYFEHLVREGFEKRFKDTDKYTSDIYKDRIQYEIDMIKKMEFEDYFLIVWDYIKYAKDNGIYVGPGRGSVVGSLVAYCLKITNLDPIPYGLLFERFLNPERVSWPDIDVDFEDGRREEVIEYVKRKYGEKCVSRIVTYGTLAPRAVVRDVARVLEYDYSFADMISKSIPQAPEMTIDKALAMAPDFKKMYDENKDVREVVDIARKLEGLPRHKSQHACFDAETLITTSKGLKRIIDVHIGDEVLTYKNRFKPVVDLVKTQAEKVYTIKTTSSFPLEVTGNHPFYVREMTRKPLYKYRDGKNSSVKTFSEPMWKEVSKLVVGQDYIGIPINQNSIIPQIEDGSLPFDKKSFWWIIGRYIGDGWTEYPEYKKGNSKWRNKRVVICCSKINAELEAIKIKLDEIGFEYWVETARTTYKIHINNSISLFDYLQNFGKYAHRKHLNEDIFSLPEDLLSSFLDGYISSDGSFNQETNRYSFKTVSKELAMGIMQVVNKVYHRPANITFIPEKVEYIEGREVQSKEKYQLYFTKDVRGKEKSFYENGYIWTRLSSIKTKEESRPMYNLTVLDDSSYVANGLCAHNCGIIIASNDVDSFVPEVLLEDKNVKGAKTRTAAFNMKELELLGLLKMDFLGLRNMGIFGEALRLINKRPDRAGKPLLMDDIPLDDPYVYKFISTGNTSGIFQIESPGMQNLMKQMFSDVSNKVAALEDKYDCKGYVNTEFFGDKSLDAEIQKEIIKNFLKEMRTFGEELFERLIAAISLYRPGPMDYIPDYISGMNDPANIHYDTPMLESLLKTTYGVIVYQEQVQQIVQKLAGYSLGRGDLIRRAMGKKNKKIMEPEREVFLYGNEGKKKPEEALVIGSIKNGVTETASITIWDKMAKFALYAFNKSHSAGYAVIAIGTAFLKFYYSVEFMTATLNSVITKANDLKFYLSETHKMGIELLPPDVNNSAQRFSIEKDAIRIGLMGLRNLGKMSEPIVSEREANGPYKNIEDFLDRLIATIDKRAFESLIYAGAVDCFKGTRQSKITVIPDIVKFLKDMRDNKFEDMWFTLPELDDVYKEMKAIKFPVMDEFDKRYKLEKEYEFAGLYITEHPIDEYAKRLEEAGVLETIVLMPVEDEDGNLESVSEYDGKFVKVAGILREVKQHYTKKGDLMYFFNLEDRTGDIKCVLFPKNVDGNEASIKEGKVVVVDGKVETSDRGTQIIANQLYDVERFEDDKPEYVLVAVDDKDDFEVIRKIIFDNVGSVPVYVKLDGKNYKAPKGIHLSLSAFLNLKNTFGKNLTIKY